VVDVVVESTREGLMNEILYTDDLALMAETMEDLSEKFQKWKPAFESKGIKVNLGKMKVMVSESKGEVPKSKIDLCGMCGERVRANSSCRVQKMNSWEMCKDKEGDTQHGETFQFVKVVRKDDMVEPVEELCDGVKTVKRFCYLGDKGECQWGM